MVQAKLKSNDSYTKSLPPEKQACYIDYLYGCIFAYGAQINKNYSGQQPSSTIFSQAISKHQFLINPLPWAGLWTNDLAWLLSEYRDRKKM